MGLDSLASENYYNNHPSLQKYKQHGNVRYDSIPLEDRTIIGKVGVATAALGVSSILFGLSGVWYSALFKYIDI